jgi:phosphohistidine phosphatase
MQIVLIRHIKSSWDDFSLKDFDRPIQKSRKDDLRKVLIHLGKQGIKPDFIYSSAAKRTMQTTKVVCDFFDFDFGGTEQTEAIYECSAEDLMGFLKANLKFCEKTNFIIGHNPAITDFANKYLAQNIENVPTSGAIIFEADKDWKMKFKLFLQPKRL